MAETPATVISCPHCGREIALDEALSQRIRQQMQREIDAELAEKKSALQQAAMGVAREKEQLDEERKGLDAEMARRVAEERARLRKELQKDLEEQTGLELAALRDQVAEKEKRIGAFRESELKLRREKAELEEARRGPGARSCQTDRGRGETDQG